MKSPIFFENDLQNLERIRRGHLWFLLVMVPVTCAIAVPLLIAVLPSGLFFPVAAVVPVLVAAGLCNLFDRTYRRKIKHSFMQDMMRALNVKYKPSGMFRAGAVTRHYLFPLYNKEEAEDVFVLKVADRRVEMQEIRLYGETSENPTFFHYLMPVDRGLLIRVPARRKRDFHTVAFTRGLLGARGYKAFYVRLGGYERVPFGNTLFSRNFIAVSQDSSDAHDIFDPAFIEQLVAFRKKIHARSLTVSFRDDEIVFYARSARNLFEPGHLFKSVTPGSINQVLEEMHALESVIETLKLNPYVGL